jgi:hypothetical protein
MKFKVVLSVLAVIVLVGGFIMLKPKPAQSPQANQVAPTPQAKHSH